MKKILFITLFIIVIAAIVVAIRWNKAPATVDDQKGMAITAEELTRAFGVNEAKANADYLNKVMDVTGTVAEVSRNQDNKTVLLLSSDDPLSGVQCTMRGPGMEAPVGKKLTVKGFCNGYTVVVLLSDCVIK